MRETLRFPGGGLPRHGFARWLGVGVLLAGAVALHGACSLLQWGEQPAPPPVPSFAPHHEEMLLPEGYGEVLALIEKGSRSEARKRLEAGLERPAAAVPDAAIAFELAAALLAEQTDAGRLKAFRETFHRYALSLPAEGPARDHAERVLRLLNNRIREADRERSRTRALHEFVQKQQKELEDLEFKLRRLEEIQQETELKREDFLHK